MKLPLIKKFALIYVYLLASQLVNAQNIPICRDSSFSIQYASLTGTFGLTKQILLNDGSRVWIGKFHNQIFDPRVLITKINKDQSIAWCKQLNPDPPYVNLTLYALAEAGNGNLAISGILVDQQTQKHFYRLFMQPDGSILKQDVINFSPVNLDSKGVHTITRLSNDSLLFFFYNQSIINGSNGLVMSACDNDGNIGSTSLLALPFYPDYEINFSVVNITGSRIGLYGSGSSADPCTSLNWTGSFNALEFDWKTKSVLSGHTYCVPQTNYAVNGLPPNPSNSINQYSFRTFVLSNGTIAMVRLYKGLHYTLPNTPVPMLIAYFDKHLKFLKGEFVKSSVSFTSPSAPDILITPDGTKHISFRDSKTRQLYYAVADSSNNFILQKKMPLSGIADNPNYTLGTEVIEKGKMTGFTTNSYYNNRTYINYIQIKREDVSSACFGEDTVFLSFIPQQITRVPSSVAQVLQTNTQTVAVNFSSSDFLLSKTNICTVVAVCDTIKLHGPDKVCSINTPVKISALKNSSCNEKVVFNFDKTAVSSYQQPNDTTILISFQKSWKGTIYATLSGCKLISDSLAVTVSSPSEFQSLGEDLALCPGKNHILKAGPSFETYKWQDNSTDSMYTVGAPGKYYVSAIDYCSRQYSDTIIIRNDSLNIIAGSLPVICMYEKLALTANHNYETYKWAPSYKINNTTTKKVIVSPEVTTTYYLSAQLRADCVIKDSIKIHVSICPTNFSVPNAFSPNRDGKNDNFRPLIIGKLEKYEMTIFNKWGQLVFQTKNQNEGWDGRFNEARQGNGIYIWICKYAFYNGQSAVSKGVVTLIR